MANVWAQYLWWVLDGAETLAIYLAAAILGSLALAWACARYRAWRCRWCRRRYWTRYRLSRCRSCSFRD